MDQKQDIQTPKQPPPRNLLVSSMHTTNIQYAYANINKSLNEPFAKWECKFWLHTNLKKIKITIKLKLEVMAVSMHGISCNLLRCCHSVVTTTNPFVAGVALYDWLKDLALLPEVKQHEKGFPVWHNFLHLQYNGAGTNHSSEKQEQLNSSVRNIQHVTYSM